MNDYSIPDDMHPILTASRQGQDNRGHLRSAAISNNILSWQHVATCGNMWHPGRLRAEVLQQLHRRVLRRLSLASLVYMMCDVYIVCIYIYIHTHVCTVYKSLSLSIYIYIYTYIIIRNNNDNKTNK